MERNIDPDRRFIKIFLCIMMLIFMSILVFLQPFSSEYRHLLFLFLFFVTIQIALWPDKQL